MVKLGHNVYMTIYCNRLWHAPCDFDFLDFSIKYLSNATIKLACQMSVFEMLAQVNFSKDLAFGGFADSVYK